MKRNSKSQEKLTPIIERIEVPYAFGTLIISPYLDPITNNSTGLLKVVDEENGYCFGLINATTGNLSLQDELEKTVKFVSSKLANTQIEITKVCKHIPIRSLSKSKVSPCTSKQADAAAAAEKTVQPSTSKKSLSSKRSFEELSDSDKNVSSSAAKKIANKFSKTGSLTDIETKVSPRNDISISKLMWGVLNFYSCKNLIYTHYLWGEEALSINCESMKNVRNFNLGIERIESLADDFRYVLGKGFTLKKEPGLFSKIEFKRSDEEKKSFYKILNSNNEIEIKTNDPTIIYDGNLALYQLENKVKKPEDGYDIIDSLYVIIVINNTFLNKMGISMERITRKSADKMPYYLVLKMNTEFDTLNSHILSLVNIN